MQPRLKSLLFWAIWFVVMAFAIGLVVWSAHSAPREVPRGTGAKALLKGIKQSALPPVPASIVAPPKTHTYYYAVNATDNAGLSSSMSSEVVYSGTANYVTLAWDHPLSPNVIANYTLFRGTNSQSYNRSWPAGTNLTIVVPPLPPSNVVVTITGLGFYLNLTNPTGFKTYKGTNMAISKRYQY